jgi:2-polyprenyl-3-methyl-5-hydroxy-6-metoxy-1,4-benzoquinol methylase
MTSAVAGVESLEVRARKTGGSSSAAIYAMVVDGIRSRGIKGGHLVDVGCGNGAVWSLLRHQFTDYCGMDAIRYDGFPPTEEFRQADFDCPGWPIAAHSADLVVSIETIEHIENPWAFMRGLVRIGKPGAWIIVTTPNQLSWLSLASLLLRHRFSAFTDVDFPMHRTALLESDLRRLAGVSRLEEVAIQYTCSGRIPKTPWHYPSVLSRTFPRGLSGNLMLIARKPRA